MIQTRNNFLTILMQNKIDRSTSKQLQNKYNKLWKNTPNTVFSYKQI